MTKRVLLVGLFFSLFLNQVVALEDAAWDYTYTGSSITNAAIWSDPANWVGGVVADSANYNAILSGANGMRFIRIAAPLTIASLTGTLSGSNISVITSDDPLVIDNPSSGYHIHSGYFYANITSPAGTGPVGNGYFCGPISVATRFTLAGGTAAHRLDMYATSSNPVRNNDMSVPQIYHGGAGWQAVGPRSAPTVDGSWYVTAGLPYIFPAGSEHVVAVGTIVESDDIFPEGTFVKRIFPDNSVELSQPAAAESESGIKTLNFAAFNPSTLYTINEWGVVSENVNTTRQVAFMKHSEEDDFRVQIKVFTPFGSSTNATFYPNLMDATLVPAPIVIHDADHPNSGNLYVHMGTCHLEFAETGRPDGVSGLPGSTLTFANGSTTAKARLTVTNNITAYINNFTGWTGSVIKDGAGTLVIAATNQVAKNKGSLTINEGCVALSEDSWVKNVTVAQNGRLKISGEFEPDTLILEPGATVEGPGVLSLPAGTQLEGVSFINNLQVRLPDGGEIFDEPPVPAITGTPAFWIDVSQINTITFKDDDGINVERINDIRGAEYGFATNAIHAPTLVRDENGNPHHIRFIRRYTQSSVLDSCTELVWDKPITNIRTVFMVQDTTDGGGQFLGKTDRIGGTGDFMRAAENGPYYNARVVHYSIYQDKVRNGKFYVNGDLRDFEAGYPYKGGGNTRYNDEGESVTWWTPHVDSIHTTGDTAADAFSFNSSATGRSGFRRVCEFLIYTNTVTETERLAITGYLMQKWINCEVSSKRVEHSEGAIDTVHTSTLAGIDVAEHNTAYIGSIQGAGEFTKSGAGTLVLDDYANADGTLHVAQGEVVLNSDEVTVDDIPAGAYFHVDASDLDTLTTTALPSDEQRVLEWRDIRGAGYPYAYPYTTANTNYAILRASGPNNQPVVDFGPYLSHPTRSWADRLFSPALMFKACASLRSAFLVYGSAQGGGSIIGSTQRDTHGWLHGYGLQRTFGGGGDHTVPIITNLYSTAFNNLILPGGMRTRLNGEYINATESGLSGGWDLISLVSYEAFGAGGFSSNNFNKDVGGQEIGEAIFYQTGLSRQDTEKVEAYLAKKWFNRETPGFRSAVASNLVVASGATLTITGSQPMSTSALSGSGVIKGGVQLGDSAVFEVFVKPDGSIDPLTVNGTINLDNGGIVHLTGSVDQLTHGQHILLNCNTLTPESQADWSVNAGALAGRVALSVRVMEGKFVLNVFPFGTLMLIQ